MKNETYKQKMRRKYNQTIDDLKKLGDSLRVEWRPEFVTREIKDITEFLKEFGDHLDK